MAYKFQRGKAILSGSITAEEGFDANGQEVAGVKTLSNQGFGIEVVEQLDAKAPIRMSGSNALEFADNQHAIKNLANNLEFVVQGQTRLEVRNTQIDAKLKIQLSGNQPIEFGNDKNKILKATGVENLEFYANNGKRLEVRDNLVEALVSISSSNDLQAGGQLQAGSIALGDANGIAGNGLTDSSGVLNIQLSGGANAGLSLNGDGIALATTINGDRTFANDITINGTASIDGDLVVNGSTTTISTTELTVADAVITIADGDTAFTAGRGFEIGTGTNTLGNFKTAAAIGAQGVPNHFASSLAISASSFHGDGSKLTGVSATGITETVQPFSVSSNVSASAGTIILAQSASAPYTLTLEPAADSSGKLFKIKREDGQNVTITAAAGNIDGEPSIVLESEYAAVSVFSNGTNYYVI